ncbi:MAG: sporulation protein YtfJ [Clostridiales bacterium]|jgi:sporulation protein YtfJ|nr:sporulation protein YtfJ [Clostridiales bacterium]
MSDHPIKDMMGITMEKIKEMVDVNTIIGEPIVLADGTTIIPISKVSFGFASGGSDLPAKVERDLFGGGTGAGVSIQPIAFLVIINGEAKLLQVSMNASSQNAIINLIPDMVDKISDIVEKSKKSDKNEKK